MGETTTRGINTPPDTPTLPTQVIQVTQMEVIMPTLRFRLMTMGTKLLSLQCSLQAIHTQSSMLSSFKNRRRRERQVRRKGRKGRRKYILRSGSRIIK